MFGIVSTDMLISFQGEYDIYIVFSKVPYNELFQALAALKWKISSVKSK